MGVIDQMKKRRFAYGGALSGLPGNTEQLPGTNPENPPPGGSSRTYVPMANSQDYYTYGEGPEHKFFEGTINAPPLKPGNGLPDVHIPEQGGGTNWANVITGIPTLGKTIALAGDVLQGAGLDNAFTQGMEKYGGMLANPAKTAVDWYKDYQRSNAAQGALSSLANNTQLGDLSNVFSDSIQGMSDQQLANYLGSDPAIFDSSTFDVGDALGTAGNLAGVATGINEGGAGGYAKAAANAAALAGYGGAVPYVGVASDLAQGNYYGAGVDVAGLAMGSPIAAIGNLAAAYANKAFLGDASKDRNMSAFNQVNPLGLIPQHVVLGRTAWDGYYDPKSGKFFSPQYVGDLAGSWYGAVAAPDGNQDQWSQKYQDYLANPQYIDMPRGYHWDENSRKVVRNAHGGPIHGHLGNMLVDHFRSGGDQYVQGPGTGRSDEIDAKLSNGEYVMDAETVAMLGDGSSEAGARKLDELRANLRRHKGKVLAKGKFSPNAKEPDQYMRGQK